MKRCPECRRDYYDDTLLYCLEDGTALVQGSVPSPEEPATAILPEFGVPPSGGVSSESATRAQISTTGQTAVLPSGVADGAKAKVFDKRVLAAPFLLAAIVLGGFYGYRYLKPAGSGPINSIAVLPFENRGGDADSDYLSDGLTESLIYRLSQLHDLRVSPTSSVFRYKGKQLDPAAIARELGVDSVLTGRIVQRGDNLAISVNLVDTRTDKSLWGEQFDRKVSELLATQQTIASEITIKLQLKLSGDGQKVLAKQYTTHPEAYQLYLKGNFHRTKYTEEGYKKGIEYYQYAIDIDPNYALAYFGIAAAYDFANGWYMSSKGAMEKAKAAALKAIELDDTLPEAHYVLGKTTFWNEWNWKVAEREWKRANELDPSYPALYPHYLSAFGRFEEAIAVQETEHRRMPLDLNIMLDSAGVYLFAGRYDQAIETCQRALELDPEFWWAYQIMGLAFERKKQYPEAIAALERARRADINPSSLGFLGYVYAAAGKKAEAEHVLEELRELSKNRYVSPYNFAVVYAGLDQKDEAFEWLERAYADRSFYMALLRVETVLDNLRPDPRFKELMKRVGLPD